MTGKSGTLMPLLAAAVAALAIVVIVTGRSSVEHAAGRLAVSAAVRTLPRTELTGVPLDTVGSGPVSYLVVGTDRREGLPADVPAMGALSGQRADSVTLWSVGPTGAVSALSVPRDVRVAVPGHADQKLAGSLDYGSSALLAAFRRLTGLPVHHYVEVDFAGFREAVDALGGVQLDHPRPLRDLVTKLRLPAGRVWLDGTVALAYARSRHLEERREGRWVQSAGGDLERITRQQRLVAAILAQLAATPDPPVVVRLARAVRAGVTVDAGLGSADVERLSHSLLGAGVVLCTLPTRPQLPAASAASPFPPYHPGSVGFRLVDTATAPAVIETVATPRGRAALPPTCRWAVLARG